MRKIVVVVGGRGKRDERNHSQNLEVIFYDTRTKSKVSMRALETVVKKADLVFLMTDACSHESMYLARRLSKRYNKPISYRKRTGIKSLLESAQEMLRKK